LAKCNLLENLPTASFQANFYDGVKVVIGKGGLYTITIPASLNSTYPSKHTKRQSDGNFTVSTKDVDSLEPCFASVLKHTHDCQRQCIQAEQKALEKDPNMAFPLILKSHQSRNNNKISSRPNSPPTSIHPSQASFYTHGNGTEDGRPPKPRITSDMQRLKTSNAIKMDNASNISMTTHQSHFMAKVGWCVSTVDKRFSMLFLDGIQVVVNPKNKTLEYHDESGRVQE
jgi:Polo-like Kinase 4 Polo Box 2